MIVKKYRSVVTSVENPLKGIFTLEMQSLTGPFRYAPGQFLHIALDTEYDGAGQWPESRCFSMQSSPDEDNIRITYAVKGRFTKMMEQQLKAGSEVWLKLPYGDLFTRQHNKAGTVFIAGGTGITPFLSLFNHASFKEYSDPHIYLGFRSEELNIYDRELKSVKPYVPEISYDNIDGPLDIRGIFSENGNTHDYFISGPPAMINSFKSQLVSMGVPPGQVHSDDWE
jgi:ferredoxin-NADP reductase